MNFLEAVQALRDAKCEAIRAAHFILIHHDGDLYPTHEKDKPWIFPSQLATRTDWELVNPKPQTETVELSAYKCPSCFRLYDNNHPCTICNKSVVELRGSYEKESKPKVRRRAEIEVIGHDNNGNVLLSPTRTNTSYDKFYHEWEE